ncbi:glycoside hydrolase family 2 protein [Natronolimnobius baerhuensis]|uniref:Beta-glucuronidase n=1 Tax=Natronolimnobius baerhuensis TaxID=253108 RepID=A0A202E4Q7_9EURY|nr:glycoside hydrolase family 2 TIM barrel-domain containing protein [Natronolimnobius baerhuensis]OVE82890.1 beta-glucuronidase [Natronolimnobius baerhuensis]
MHLLSYPRDSVSLDGTWQAIPDQYEMYDGYFEDMVGDDDEDNPAGFSPKSIYEVGASEQEGMPVDFNVHDGYSVDIPASFGEAVTEFRHYEGWVWFARTFDWDAETADDQTHLQFGAVNYKAEVWLNGERLGEHEGGFTPFSFDVTDELVDGENLVVVKVDNKRYDDGIPNASTDWFNFGGINRSVELVSVPETYIRNYKLETELSEDSVHVSVQAWVEHAAGDAEVTASLPELDTSLKLTADDDGVFTGEVTLARTDVTLWSPSDPRLYTLEVTADSDTLEEAVGLREVEVVDGDIQLNGEDLWLRGIALHEESAGKGRALDIEDVNERFEWLSELGCNYARLAHYPHTEEMARKADEEGILLWEEVPAYWDINFGDEEIQELYRQQLREVTQRDWNRASVALWSIANETDHKDDTRNEVLPQMADYVRELDETRLVTAACFVDDTDDGIVLKDPLKENLDVVGINQYYGWYYGDADDMQQFQEDPDGTPVVVSETGGGAKWGHHGDEDERWTEEFQAEIYRGQTEAIDGNDQIAGMAPWILFDFRAPMRQNEHQRGYNRKGVVDQHGRKKQAFHVLREFYQEKRP